MIDHSYLLAKAVFIVKQEQFIEQEQYLIFQSKLLTVADSPLTLKPSRAQN